MFTYVQEVNKNSCDSNVEIGKHNQGMGGGLVTLKPTIVLFFFGDASAMLETVEPGTKRLFLFPKSWPPMILNYLCHLFT